MTTMLTYILLGTVLAIVATKKLNRMVTGLACQSVALAAVGLVTAIETNMQELYVATLLTFLVKAVAIPAVLYYVIRKIGIKKELDTFISIKNSLLFAGGLIISAYYFTPRDLSSAAIDPKILPGAVALMMCGLLIMVTRKKAITQVIGLMIMENGLYLTALATTKGLPFVVELGVFLDLLIGALIMGIFTFRISQTYDSINTSRLTNLKG